MEIYLLPTYLSIYSLSSFSHYISLILFVHVCGSVLVDFLGIKLMLSVSGGKGTYCWDINRLLSICFAETGSHVVQVSLELTKHLKVTPSCPAPTCPMLGLQTCTTTLLLKTYGWETIWQKHLGCQLCVYSFSHLSTKPQWRRWESLQHRHCPFNIKFGSGTESREVVMLFGFYMIRS